MKKNDLFEIIKKKSTGEFLGRGNVRYVYKVQYEDKDYVIAISKGKDKGTQGDFKKRKTHIDKLIEENVQTPKLIGQYFDGQNTFEVQELGKGHRLFERGVDRYATNIGVDFDKLSSPDKKTLTIKFKKDYQQKQLALLNMSTENYIKFFDNAMTLLKHFGTGGFDCHADNFLLDEKDGITFVDLGCRGTSKPSCEKEELLKQGLRVFTWILGYGLSGAELNFDGEKIKPMVECADLPELKSAFELNKKILNKAIKVVKENSAKFGVENSKNIVEVFLKTERGALERCCGTKDIIEEIESNLCL